MTILDAIPAGYVLHRPGEHGRDLNMQELLDRVRDDLHPGQRAFVDDCSTQILGVSAGYGAGKTRALAAKTLFMAAANQGFTGCVMEPTGPLIRDIWMNDFEEFLEGYEVFLYVPGLASARASCTCPKPTPKRCRSSENWPRSSA